MFADSLDTFLQNMSVMFMFNECKTCLNLEFKNFCSQALDMDGWVVRVLSLVRNCIWKREYLEVFKAFLNRKMFEKG